MYIEVHHLNDRVANRAFNLHQNCCTIKTWRRSLSMWIATAFKLSTSRSSSSSGRGRISGRQICGRSLNLLRRRSVTSPRRRSSSSQKIRRRRHVVVHVVRRGQPLPLLIRQFNKLDGERSVVVVVVLFVRHSAICDRSARTKLWTHERLDDVAVELRRREGDRSGRFYRDGRLNR